MKMAKASERDIQAVLEFFNELELAVEDGIFTRDDGEEFTDETDETLANFVRDKWDVIGPSWRRVVFGCEVLILNCCDPNADTLEWRPDIEEHLSKLRAEGAIK